MSDPPGRRPAAPGADRTEAVEVHQVVREISSLLEIGSEASEDALLAAEAALEAMSSDTDEAEAEPPPRAGLAAGLAAPSGWAGEASGPVGAESGGLTIGRESMDPAQALRAISAARLRAEADDGATVAMAPVSAAMLEAKHPEEDSGRARTPDLGSLRAAAKPLEKRRGPESGREAPVPRSGPSASSEGALRGREAPVPRSGPSASSEGAASRAASEAAPVPRSGPSASGEGARGRAEVAPVPRSGPSASGEGAPRASAKSLPTAATAQDRPPRDEAPQVPRAPSTLLDAGARRSDESAAVERSSPLAAVLGPDAPEGAGLLWMLRFAPISAAGLTAAILAGTLAGAVTISVPVLTQIALDRVVLGDPGALLQLLPLGLLAALLAAFGARVALVRLLQGAASKTPVPRAQLPTRSAEKTAAIARLRHDLGRRAVEELESGARGLLGAVLLLTYHPGLGAAFLVVLVSVELVAGRLRRSGESQGREGIAAVAEGLSAGARALAPLLVAFLAAHAAHRAAMRPGVMVAVVLLGLLSARPIQRLLGILESRRRTPS